MPPLCTFRMHQKNRKWALVVNTFLNDPQDISQHHTLDANELKMGPYSSVIFKAVDKT